jgi:hypothetical protein
LLHFDESVVVQRFGEVNQRILSSDKGAGTFGNPTFPKAGRRWALPVLAAENDIDKFGSA